MLKLLKDLSLISLFSLIACGESTSFKESDLTKVWRLAEVVSINSVDEETSELMKPTINDLLVVDGFLLCLFPDKSYTQIMDYTCETGMWELFDDNIIHFGDNQLRVDRIENIKGGRYIVGDTKIKEGDLDLKLRWLEESSMLESFKNDPFYSSNNEWRHKPNKNETNEEIKDRLLNYIYHFAMILKSSTERGNSVVSFSHSQGIIRVYRGGIGRVKKEQIPDDWINCFFNKEDAIKAYELFSEQLVKNKYRGATTGDWVKDDYNILIHLYNQMKMN